MFLISYPACRLILILSSLNSKLQRKVVKQRELADKGKLRSFEPGELLLRKIPGLTGALQANWEGPYKVLEKISDVNYKVILDDGNRHEAKSPALKPT